MGERAASARAEAERAGLTTFVVRGTVDGRGVALVWRGGELDGDPMAVARVQELVDTGMRLPMTPTGPEITAALQPGWVALRTISEALDEVVAIEGDVGTPPYLESDYPPGAVFAPERSVVFEVAGETFEIDERGATILAEELRRRGVGEFGGDVAENAAALEVARRIEDVLTCRTDDPVAITNVEAAPLFTYLNVAAAGASPAIVALYTACRDLRDR